ncbi:MAG TPA: helix-turn-helix domain-containing protein [Candidatus Anaeromassilibacillus stercoravium]|nr:helix-turn-helix domain-containing protein [Candidatus Anaeromassilibacillus stercoravium]
MDMEVVGKRIQALRKEHKMTQQQLAEAIDISEKYLSNIETGKDICSIHVILNIANLLDASVDDLLGSNLKYNRFHTPANGAYHIRLINETYALSEKECAHLLRYIELMKEHDKK